MSRSQIRFLIDEDTSHVIRDGLQRRQPEVEVRVIGGYVNFRLPRAHLNKCYFPNTK